MAQQQDPAQAMQVGPGWVGGPVGDAVGGRQTAVLRLCSLRLAARQTGPSGLSTAAELPRDLCGKL